MVEKWTEDFRNKALRNIGFLRRERYQALGDPDLKSPISPKLFQEKNWFYETVLKRRKEAFEEFKIDANKRGLTYDQKLKEWNDIVRQWYKGLNSLTVRGGTDFWAMFRRVQAQAKKDGWVITPDYHDKGKKYVQTENGFMARLDNKVIAEQRRKLKGR